MQRVQRVQKKGWIKTLRSRHT